MFHTDSDPLQFIADIADKNSSGAEVHIAKIVNHMNNGDNLKILATLTLEFMSLSAENHSKNNHNISIITARNIILQFINKASYQSMVIVKKYKQKKIFDESQVLFVF